MFNIRQISLKLLLLESILLVIPSIAGFVVLVIGFFHLLFGIIPRLNVLAVVEIAFALIALMSLIAFWNFLLDIHDEKIAKGAEPIDIGFLLASLGMLLTILSVVLNSLSIRFLEFFLLGQLYVPTYLHLLFEIKRQTGKVDF